MTSETFRSKKWGVFCHYLYGKQNGTGPENTRGFVTPWKECVEDFDCELLASQLSSIGAGYIIFTMQQGTRHFIAPNKTFEDMTGLRDGCSERDLVLDLYASLSRRGIDLFLYYTGDGMSRDPDPEAAKRFGYHGGVGGVISEDFVKMWSGPLKEYALRYGDKVAGWWFDGVYKEISYDDNKLSIFKNAVRAGNPEALVANNFYGCLHPGTQIDTSFEGTGYLRADFFQTIAPPTPLCDFTAGELVYFNAFPDPDRDWDALPHVLSFLGIPERPWEVYNGWGMRGCKYSPDYLAAYIGAFNRMGGVVTADMCLRRDGGFDEDQLRAMDKAARLLEKQEI
ncbi:MAG: hypothetical protein J5950_05400 [Clostridia bacterium]|nr:hypothetical protein [Clostridia bacterium]